MEVHETVYEPWIATSVAARKRLRGAFHVDDEGRKMSGTTTTRITSVQINEPIDEAALTIAGAFELDDPVVFQYSVERSCRFSIVMTEEPAESFASGDRA